MEIADVVKIRNALKKGDKKLSVYMIGDNMILADELHHILKWDDANGILYWVRRSEGEVSQSDRPFEVYGTSYENIQYIHTNLNEDNFKAFAKEAKFTDKEIEVCLRECIFHKHDFIKKNTVRMD